MSNGRHEVASLLFEQASEWRLVTGQISGKIPNVNLPPLTPKQGEQIIEAREARAFIRIKAAQDSIAERESKLEAKGQAPTLVIIRKQGEPDWVEVQRDAVKEVAKKMFGEATI